MFHHRSILDWLFNMSSRLERKEDHFKIGQEINENRTVLLGLSWASLFSSGLHIYECSLYVCMQILVYMFLQVVCED